MVTSAELRHSVGLEPSGWALPDPDDDGSEPRMSRPARLTITAVIGLALVGLALTAVGVVLRSAGETHTLPHDPVDPPIVVDHQVDGADGAAETVIVHVTGRVVRPGIVELDTGSRVIDAIDAAGGLDSEADGEALNLARVLTDGEQVHVPAVGEEVRAQSAGSSETPPGPISLSRADQATLETLPGVGPALAQRIIAWRESNGPFRSVSDVLAVSGIGPATLEGFADRVVP